MAAHVRTRHSGPTVRTTHAGEGYDAVSSVPGDAALVAGEQQTGDDLVPGSVDAADVLVPGSMDITPFASSIRPIALVDTLPTLPDPNYPVGAFVYKTSDVPARLYKNVADAWVAAIGTNDLQADSITAGQIAAGAIGTTELAAGAVTVGNLADGLGQNMAPNPSFENLGGQPASTDGVPIFGWSTGAHARYSNSVVAKFGAMVLRQAHLVSIAQKEISSPAIPVTPARRIVFRTWVRGIAGNNAAAGISLVLSQYKQDGTVVSHTGTGTVTVGASTTWTQVTFPDVFSTLDPLTAYVIIRLKIDAVGAVGDQVFFDGVEFFYADFDVVHAGGNVTIDSTGLTINNGKLTIRDEYGATVAGAGGFAGGWYEFIHSGLYGSDFRRGTPGVLVDGRNPALPYWTVSRVGSPTMTLVADATWAAGRKIQVAFSALADRAIITSDVVPARGGIPYTMGSEWGQLETAGALQVNFRVRWFDASMALISSWNSMWSAGAGFIGPQRVAITQPWGTESPSNTQYASVEVTFQQVISHDATQRLYISGLSLMPAAQNVDPAANLHFAQLQVGSIYLSGNYETEGGSGHGNLNIDPDGAMLLTNGAGSQRFSMTSDGLIDIYKGNTFTTYTPATTGFGTATFTSKSGAYLVIGKMCFVSVRIVVNAAGSGAAFVGIGLPLTADIATVGSQPLSGLLNLTSNAPCVGLIGGGGSATSIDRIYKSTAATGLTGVDIVAGRVIQLSGWYMLA